MGYDYENAMKEQHGAEAVSGSSWGYVAIGLSVCALFVPTLIAYLVFPAALACTIVAVRKKAPGASLEIWPLVGAGLGLVYASYQLSTL